MKIKSKDIKGFYDISRDGMTQSLISLFLSCRRKAKLYLDGWDSKWFSEAMTYGSLGHGMLELVYLDIAAKKLDVPPEMRKIQRYSDIVEKKWLTENPKPSTENLVKIDEMLALLEQTLFQYFRYWSKDFKKVRWLALEEQFRTKCSGVDLRGKRDGKFLVRKEEVWLLENKFKSRVEEDDIADSLSIDFQSLEYIWSEWKDSGKLPAGMLYNIVRRPGLKQKQNETTATFAKRVGTDIESRPEFYFIRFEVPFSMPDVLAFQKDLENIILDFQEWLSGEGRDYKNPYNCLGKYGKCVYLNACANDNYSNLVKRKTVFKELEDLV